MDKKDQRYGKFIKHYTGVSGRVYSYLLILVHNREDAEELLQETAMVLWTKYDEYEEGTNFGAWAISIARLKALEFLRKRTKTRMVFDDHFYELVSDRAAKSSHDFPNRVDSLKKCLEKLPEIQKQLLSMRFKKNISIINISQITGRPLGSLYHQFSKLIRALRDCIDKQLIRQMG